MIQYNVFPNGTKRVVTFSYDDGSENDKRLIDLFNKYSVKGTFHLNGKKYIGISEEEKKKIRDLYAGHEISCHTVHHGWPERMPPESLIGEIWEDRKILEDIAGYQVVGMSYPSGSYNELAKTVLRACGIVYSRTTKGALEPSRGGFENEFPSDFLEWHPTCHHRNAASLTEKYIENIDSVWTRPLMYIWGHSHEFKTEEDWAYIEKIVSSLAGRDNVWYATNIEIYDYLNAVRSLRVSADEKILSNPSALDVWVEKDKEKIIKIPAGQTVYTD